MYTQSTKYTKLQRRSGVLTSPIVLRSPAASQKSVWHEFYRLRAPSKISNSGETRLTCLLLTGSRLAVVRLHAGHPMELREISEVLDSLGNRSGDAKWAARTEENGHMGMLVFVQVCPTTYILNRPYTPFLLLSRPPAAKQLNSPLMMDGA
jgi:hypothetical protein